MKLELFIVLSILASVYCRSYTVTSKIYMDIKLNKKPLGRVVFGLFGKEAPKAVENFRQICLNGINGTTYIGSKFHRVIDRFIVQGGDIVSGDGHGSTSIYGDYFEDENLTIEHNRPGYLGMANRGPNTNGCQFYVNTISANWLNGKHVIFGRVVEGLDVIYDMESVKTDTEDIPLEPLVITNCGEMPTEPYPYYPDDYDLWGWFKAAGPALCSSFGVLFIFHYFYRQLDMYC